MSSAGSDTRKQLVNAHKRELILQAARRVFEAEGLEGASLRAIARASGYTPAALYFHFASKEAVYGALLEESLTHLQSAVDTATESVAFPKDRMRAAALAFFRFYLDNPKDLELGFYMSQSGMSPKGVGGEQNSELNNQLLATLTPIAEAAMALGASETQAQQQMAAIFAHATGILLLTHTRRIRLFDVDPQTMIDQYLSQQLEFYP